MKAMKARSKEVFFPLFALFVIFSNELFFSFFYITQIPLMSGMKAQLAIAIAVVAYLMMICDLIKGRFAKRNLWQLVLLFLTLALYLVTGCLYPHGCDEYHLYITYLLAYGSLCIPMAYLGMRLARGGYENRMLCNLPYFLFAVALGVGSAVMTGYSEERMLGTGVDNGLNYQNSSYFMAYCFAYSVFYVFFLNDMKKNVWQKIVYFAVVPLVFLCAVGTIVGGGRGAFLNLIVSVVFILSRILWRSTGKSGIKHIVMLIGASVIMVYLAIHYDIFDSAGALRVASSLTTDDNRGELRRLAFASFGKSPLIGHGLGSVWWEVGFFSHNIFQDLLAETGIVGTLIMIVILATMFFRLVRSSKTNNLDFFILLIYICYMMNNMFSGYWIANMHLFLVFGYVYGKGKLDRYQFE